MKSKIKLLFFTPLNIKNIFINLFYYILFWKKYIIINLFI